MQKIEEWCPVGKTLTLTVEITDTDKFIPLITELNGPTPIGDSLGFSLTSWSGANVHEQVRIDSYANQTLIRDYMQSGNILALYSVLRTLNDRMDSIFNKNDEWANLDSVKLLRLLELHFDESLTPELLGTIVQKALTGAA